MPFLVNLHEAVNYETRIPRLQTCLSLMAQALGTNGFRNRVLQYECPYGKNFQFNRGLNREQIYLKIIYGSEKSTPGIDYEADMYLYLLTQNSPDRTVGYTDARQGPYIYTYPDRFRSLRTYELAGHFAHEWCHQLGFEHSENDDEMKYSVPYAVGDMITQLARQIQERLNPNT